MSLEPLKNFGEPLTATKLNEKLKQQRTFKPFLNKEELMSIYDDLFPEKKDNIKIVVAEVNGIIVFALHLLMGKPQLSARQTTANQKTATIYDLMINRSAYG